MINHSLQSDLAKQIKMKTLALLSLSLAVALGMPPFAPGVAQNPLLTGEDQSPLLGDWVPVQGHVVVENPAPQVRPGSEEHRQELALVPVDTEQKTVGLEMKVRSQVGEEQGGEVKTEVRKEPEVKPESDVKTESEVEVEQKPQAEPEVEPESEVKVDLKLEPVVQEEFQVQMNLEAETETGQDIEERHIDMEGKYEMVGKPIMELEPLDDDNMELSDTEKYLRAAFQNQDPVIQPLPEGKEGIIRETDNVLDGEPIMELENPQLEVKQELKAEPEVDVKPDVEEEFQAQMNLEAEKEIGQEIKVRNIDMEGKYEIVGEPIMELEPLDDDNTEMSDVEKSLREAFLNENPVSHHLPEEGGLLMSEIDDVLDGEPIMELEPLDKDKTELSDMEKSLRAAFQNQDPVIQPLPEEEEGIMRETDNVLDGEPIMELEPEEEELSLHQQDMPDAAIMDGSGPALDIMGQQMPSLEEYFPNEEARLGMEPGKQQDSRTEDSYYLMMEEPGSEFVREEELFEEPEMKDVPVLDGGLQIGVVPKKEKRAVEERSCCPGVILQGKRYRFFRGPKTAEDAEFFCQAHFPGGHLASITSSYIHREVMKMILQQNGAYTRTWIGGRRYVETGHFLWLDGSNWSYADWQTGEPSNTLDVEDCVEVLPHGNGKFNDFTCWEPQAFICSYPYL